MRIWRIISEAWKGDGGVIIDREPRALTPAYITLAAAIRGARTGVFVVAEEPGAGSRREEWDEIENPYHVIVLNGVRFTSGYGHIELACYNDIDVAEMAMRMWMSGH